jgi:hypothetical protein
MRLFLLPCAATGVSLLAVWCLIGATPRGQPWTPAVTRPQGCNGLSARRMAVLYTFRVPSLGRQGHREFMRNTWLDLTTIMPATTYHRRSYAERYSRYTLSIESQAFLKQCRRPWVTKPCSAEEVRSLIAQVLR